MLLSEKKNLELESILYERFIFRLYLSLYKLPLNRQSKFIHVSPLLT